METIVFYALIVAVLSGVLTFAVTLISEVSHKSLKAGIFGAVTAGISEFLILYNFMPSFAHWSNAGYFTSLCVVILSSLLIHGITAHVATEEYAEADTVGMWYIGGGGFLLVILFLLSSCSLVPPVVFGNEKWDELAGLLQVRDATEEEYRLMATDEDLMKISPTAANLEASGVTIPDSLGSYATIGNTFEQTVAGEAVYVTDFRITSVWAFRKTESALPGYIIRPAQDVDAKSVFQPGYAMRYVPGAGYNQELKRHVYMNFELGCKCKVEHLETLELDDNYQPKYTGTVWRYVIGNKGMVVTHVIVVDPVTGKIDTYPIDQVPDWIDRIYSLEKMKDRVEWWANHSAWDFRLPDNTLNKMLLDKEEDVYGPGGELYYAFTITSASNTQNLIYELRVNPRTGEAVRYIATGKTIDAVDDVIDTETFGSINPDSGAEPIECERQIILGESTIYCILEARPSSEGVGTKGAIVGYAFLRERYQTKASSVIAAPTFDEAWDALIRQHLEDSDNDADIQAQAADVIVVVGTLADVSAWPSSTGDVWFILTTETYPEGLRFVVSQNNSEFALSEVGDTLEVSVYEIEVTEYNEVISIFNSSLPH